MIIVSSVNLIVKGLVLSHNLLFYSCDPKISGLEDGGKIKFVFNVCHANQLRRIDRDR